jgi:hypothetical protein
MPKALFGLDVFLPAIFAIAAIYYGITVQAVVFFSEFRVRHAAVSLRLKYSKHLFFKMVQRVLIL